MYQAAQGQRDIYSPAEGTAPVCLRLSNPHGIRSAAVKLFYYAMFPKRNPKRVDTVSLTSSVSKRSARLSPQWMRNDFLRTFSSAVWDYRCHLSINRSCPTCKALLRKTEGIPQDKVDLLLDDCKGNMNQSERIIDCRTSHAKQ